MFAPFAYVKPESLDSAARHLREDNAVVHAGGTDLLGCMRDGIFQVDKVISLSGLKNKMSGIRETSDGGLALGALATITEIAESDKVRGKYPGLARAASEVASPQLRHQGTIGGNICQKPRCWYYRGEFDCLRKGGDICFAVNGENQFHCIFGGNGCYIVHPSDPSPALMALDAKVHITGTKGDRTVKMSDFQVEPAVDPTRETVLEPGEMVTEIYVPAPPRGLYSSYRKVRTRRSWDFAIAGMALALDMEGGKVKDGRVVFSGVAPVPWRSKAVEEVIIGNGLNDRTIEEAAQAAVRGAEPMSKNGYKAPLLKGVVRDELTKARER
jgi:xanthine dehydrogenase YagS FAD-binding subunit